MHLDYMPPFNIYLSVYHMPSTVLGAGEETEPQSPVVEAETNEDHPEEWRMCGPRTPNTSCYDQQYPGDSMTAAGFRSPPNPTVKEARDSEGWSRQKGPGAGVQVEGAHLRRQGPQGRREGGTGTQRRRGSARTGAMGSECAVEAGRACAP